MKSTISAIVGVLAVVAIAVVVGAAGSANGEAVGGIGVVVFCALLALLINWIAFVPSYLAKTERYYDLVGALSNVSIAVAAFVLGPGGLRSTLLVTMIVVWAARLGVFLFIRISRDGGDSRFDALKVDPARFLFTWSLQGLWVFLTQAAALSAMASVDSPDLSWIGGVGLAIWVAGFGIESEADRQKRAFRADPANGGRFITTGLWAWSRHPNYFGEITLWCGVALVAAPALSGWQYVTLISPLFVILLLTRVSGIPMLEAKSDKRWGDDPEYLEYRDSTPVLVLRRPH
jgi:steroid 5-alpha reductase family enzyme